MTKSEILIIDDEDLFREDLAVMLRRAGYGCATAEDASTGVEKAMEIHPDIILCDISMPDRLGTEILGELQMLNPGSAIIMLTAFGNLDSALEAFRKGAVDYLLKPVSQDELIRKIGRVDEQLRLTQEVSRLRRIIAEKQSADSFVGNSSSMLAVKDYVRRVAGADSSILITGESGTGKEIVAREIHRLSARSAAPFLAINCGAIPNQLLESELFGHTKGSFTGATEARMGFFEMAGEGTLLLDEIGDMPLSLQTKLLRALEQKEFFRVGANRPTLLRARIISSTNRDLRELTEQKSFREDLFYRINVVEISVPSLRERIDDVPALVEYFIRKLCDELGRSPLGLANGVLEVFMDYHWPGNVRQLRNVLERALILCPGSVIGKSDLPPEISGHSPPDGFEGMFRFDDLREATRNFERSFIQAVIGRCGGNREQAAKRMNVNPSTLYRKLSEWNSGG